MVRPKAGVNWYYNTLTPTLGKFAVTANVAIVAAAQELARQMRDYARENAPWQDRTTNARTGLDTAVESSGFRQEIYLFHSVEYGIWLEVRWDGRYAIIIPTLEHFEGETLWRLFDGMVGKSTLGRFS